MYYHEKAKAIQKKVVNYNAKPWLNEGKPLSRLQLIRIKWRCSKNCERLKIYYLDRYFPMKWRISGLNQKLSCKPSCLSVKAGSLN